MIACTQCGTLNDSGPSGAACGAPLAAKPPAAPRVPVVESPRPTRPQPGVPAQSGRVVAPSEPTLVHPSPPAAGPPTDEPPRRRARGPGKARYVVIGIAAVVLVAVGVLVGVLVTRSPKTSDTAQTRTSADSSSAVGASAANTSAASTSDPLATTVEAAPTTQPATTQPPETTAAAPTTTAEDLSAPTNEQRSFPVDADKCGPDAPQVGKYRPDGRYEVTATVKVWAKPNISSTPLARIDVDSYGPGGIGCPDDQGAFVPVSCKTQGQTIDGPFGADARWEKVTYDQTTGYVPDEWLDTKWDGDALPDC